MRTLVTTHHLEILRREDLRPGKRAPRGNAVLEVRRAEIPSPELNRFLYTAVGRDWTWTDRLPWTRNRWLEYLSRPGVETWVGSVAGTPCGYFELVAEGSGSVEIAYFGLLPRFTGQGLGGRLLTLAVERGFELGGRRVWLHTCSLDHPRALQNYVERGFREFRVETEWKELPDGEPPEWP